MGRPTPAHRLPATTSTHPEARRCRPTCQPDSAPRRTLTPPTLPHASNRLRTTLRFVAAIPCTPPAHHRTSLLWSPSSDFGPVSRISSPQTPFNPHISTALTAYCKSPYPHCSAHAASEHEKFWQRSTADTALEIYQHLNLLMGLKVRRQPRLCLLTRHGDADGVLRRDEVIEAHSILSNSELNALDVT